MVNGVVTAMLAVETFSDLKTKSVSVIRIIVFFVAAVVINVLSVYQSVFSMLGGMAIGLIMLFYAFLTKEGIGYGDCIIFICLGAYLGLSANLRLLFFSLIFASVVGLINAIIKKEGRKSKIPFVPFVLGTHIILWITEALL